jgi:hypothetical protein
LLSSELFPWHLAILTDLRGYLYSPVDPMVLTEVIASTTSFAKRSHSGPIILEDIEVLATFIKASLPRESTLTARFF